MTCEYPENKPSTAYSKGCRCDRCTTKMVEYYASPEVKKRKAKYRKTPEARRKAAKSQEKYRAKPEVKKRKAEYHAEWSATPENKKRKAGYDAKWLKTPKGRACDRARKAKRRARKLNQTPDYANLDLIKRIYLNCPEGYHVEHMRPLSRGGLHHENNLCYLPEAVNTSKGDRTIEEFGQEKFHASAVYWQTIL